MAAYIIANVSIDDPTRYADYTALTPGIIKKYEGEFVVRGGPVEALEGKTAGGTPRSLTGFIPARCKEQGVRRKVQVAKCNV